MIYKSRFKENYGSVPSYEDIIYEGENFKIVDARYAKGKLAIHTKPDKSGGKTREDRLAQAKGVNGKWSHREKCYIVSPAQAKRFVDYVNKGYDASAFTGELEIE